MKTLKKILPLTSLAVVGTIPVVSTSCSKVWNDLLAKTFTPSFERCETKDGTNEVTSAEIAKLYTDYFIDHPEQMVSDFYWGSSIWGRKTYPKSTRKLLTFLGYIDNVSLKRNSREIIKDIPVLSYHTRTQLQIRKEGLSDSYSIETYDLDYELNNLEFWPVHYGEVKDDGGETYQTWSLNPLKFNATENTWWMELTDNEQIKFDFKAVKKGYGKNGAQNYVDETSEAAIVDEEHKYAPQLNEVYTNAMLHDSYYLSKLKPRINIEEYTNYATRTDSTQPFVTTSDPFKIVIGEKTKVNYADCNIVVSLIGTPQFFSPQGSGLTGIEVIPATTPYPVAPGEFNMDISVRGKGHALVGDIVYYTLKLECVKNDVVQWSDYLYQSTYLIDASQTK